MKKRQRHLRKWARRRDISCYRLYEKDIPEYPAVIDWYAGEAVIWLTRRTRDETTAAHKAWRQHTLAEVAAGLQLPSAKIFIKERARQQGLDSQYQRLAQQETVRLVPEQGLIFEVNLSDYLDTGLFLDHRQTRDMVREKAAGNRILNLFAYTGSFTVYALDGQARSTTTVDLSQTYCDWAARNLAHNQFQTSAHHQIIPADCLQFLKEARQRREQYDLIICDPPTFSNSKRMKQASFVVDRDHPQLIADCLALLSPAGELIFSTNSRKFTLLDGRLPPNTDVTEITQQTVPEDFYNKKSHRCWLFKPG